MLHVTSLAVADGGLALYLTYLTGVASAAVHTAEAVNADATFPLFHPYLHVIGCCLFPPSSHSYHHHLPYYPSLESPMTKAATVNTIKTATETANTKTKSTKKTDSQKETRAPTLYQAFVAAWA
ncbi:hypothetical protein B0H17DRAFT_1216135 [Mycena rosella]|uniref:Uncharacterized protein n=1 Tax=Mycena rosella TaxID=1033263 RepID=A0AAD7CD92_MYCRO|nr:hypothetical protein B0H17DRAFT_1216135 [Mycena rosella]